MRTSSPAVWAAALTLGVPALVQAQTQLFPLAPIQRQRTPCPLEDPVYGQYRQQYFGYFPTCWRTFPAGWGCPSSEAPNMVQAFTERKRDPLPENLPDLDSGPGAGPGPDEGPAMPGGRGTPPPLPPTRSPFDLPDAAPGANPGGAGGAGAAPLPRTRSPFDLPDPVPAPNPGGAAEGTAPRAARSNPPALRPTTSRIAPPPVAPDEKAKVSDDGGPLLALPAAVEAAPTPIPVGTNDDPVGPNGALLPPGTPGASLGPQPTLPDPGFGPSPAMPRTVMNASPMPPPAIEPPVTAMAGMPVQAPQRRGRISSLFNGMTSWMRR